MHAAAAEFAEVEVVAAVYSGCFGAGGDGELDFATGIVGGREEP
ncbi:hypothetical protein [Paenarthrobacter ureafaciens]|nr:hypothetical protein [Paenarthrobacter ureafaciens]